MGSKIKVGDWLISRISGECSFVDSENFAHNANTCRGYAKAPASPADMAKSHRLMIEHAECSEAFIALGGTKAWDRLCRVDAAYKRHLGRIRRLTTKQSRRGGKGEK